MERGCSHGTDDDIRGNQEKKEKAVSRSPLDAVPFSAQSRTVAGPDVLKAFGVQQFDLENFSLGERTEERFKAREKKASGGRGERCSPVAVPGPYQGPTKKMVPAHRKPFLGKNESVVLYNLMTVWEKPSFRLRGDWAAAHRECKDFLKQKKFK